MPILYSLRYGQIFILSYAKQSLSKDILFATPKRTKLSAHTPIYEKQLSKWLTENNLTQHQQAEIKRLQEQVKQCGRSVADILSLAEEFRKGLI